MDVFLYLSLIPEALIASMLPPLEFGTYLAVGTKKRTRGQAMYFSLEGLEESPYSYQEKKRGLGHIPENSPLWPYAQLELVKILKITGEIDSALIVLKKVQKSDISQRIQLQAKTLANFMNEANQPLLKSLAIYDEILLKYQQGVISEFIRERVRYIKSATELKGKAK